MAWQVEAGASSERPATYHELLTLIVAMATSQHVATVAIDNAGTGYTAGDVVELSHAGAYLPARFEVETVGGSGEITALRIASNGAFSNRIASAAVDAGGSGYAVGDILQLDTGTARELGKVQVDTISGGAVTGVSVFESGGAYSVAPSAAGATTAVGPSTAAGTGCTLTATMTGLVGTTGLSVTGGTGSGATVDITLAESGWSVDDRNTNRRSHNGVANERETVLRGDATGRTNKPLAGFSTFTATSGINTRYIIALHGMVAHNPATAFESQIGILGTPGTWPDSRPYLLCDENAAQEMDVWLSVDDFHIAGVININSGAASTDDGQYLPFYLGYGDTYATESEDPYPMLISGPASAANVDPSAASDRISAMHECRTTSGQSSGTSFYRSEDSMWINLVNADNTNTTQARQHVMGPNAGLALISSSNPDEIVTFGPVTLYNSVGHPARGSATRRIMPVPGTTPLHLPLPLVVLSRPGGTTLNQTLDMPRLQPRGIAWVYNTNAAGATIANFSEDFITDQNGDRWRIFHNHVHTAPYQFIGIREDV